MVGASLKPADDLQIINAANHEQLINAQPCPLDTK